MNLKWNHTLTGDQLADPVVHAETVDLPPLAICPTDEDMVTVADRLGVKKIGLQTWGRAVDAAGKTILTGDPHWIAVQGSTPLHYDPRYPRYSHHLKVRVDDFTYVRGLAKTVWKLHRGLFYILDTHSPHQVFKAQRGGDWRTKPSWNIAASIDSHEVLHPAEIIPRLVGFILAEPFLPNGDKPVGELE